MTLHRRELLAAATATSAAALAGCIGGCGLGFPPGADQPHDGEIAVDPVDSVPGDGSVVELADLPEAERSLLRMAISEGVVRACMDGDGEKRADALRSFAGRTGRETHLGDGSDRYALWVRVTDIVHATTADPPSDDGNPCC